MKNPDNVAGVATSVAGSAVIGNAIFNGGEKQKDTLQAIFIIYLIFGGFYATYLYLKNLSIRSKQFTGTNYRLHVLLPLLSAIGGFAFYVGAMFGVAAIRVHFHWNMGFWMAMLMFVFPLIPWGVFSTWCFDRLHTINEEAGVEQLVGSKATAFWLQCGSVALFGVVFAFMY